MLKSIVLLCVASCFLEGRASPSMNVVRVRDSCACASQGSTTPEQASEEFIVRTIERAVSAAITRTASSMTPAPAPSKPLQITIAGLIHTLDHMTVPINVAPVPVTGSKQVIENIEATLQTLTRTVEQLKALAVTTPASESSSTLNDITSDVAPNLLTIQKLNETVMEQNETIRALDETIKQLTIPTTPVPLQCIDGYQLSIETNRCYKVHTENVKWPVANTTCNTEGAQLAIINSRQEANVLNKLKMDNNYHIGVYRDSTDRWLTVTGEDVKEVAAGYNPWADRHPFPNTEWRYGILNEGKIYLSNANHESGFICERALGPA